MLTVTPRIETIIAARVNALPSFHPEAGPSFAGFPVHAFLIHHPDGPILVDTGIGFGNTKIDEWYRPTTLSMRSELQRRDIDPDSDKLTIVNTHLHFDHCGQNHSFASARIVVQKSEAEAAAILLYTISDWAALPQARTLLVDGDYTLAEGVDLIHTPGHTPGHQSIVVRSKNETVVIAGQCMFRATEWNQLEPNSANLHDADHHGSAKQSLERLRALQPTSVLLSHDCAIHVE